MHSSLLFSFSRSISINYIRCNALYHTKILFGCDNITFSSFKVFYLTVRITISALFTDINNRLWLSKKILIRRAFSPTKPWHSDSLLDGGMSKWSITVYGIGPMVGALGFGTGFAGSITTGFPR